MPLPTMPRNSAIFRPGTFRMPAKIVLVPNDPSDHTAASLRNPNSGFCHRNVSTGAFRFRTALYWKSPPGSRTETNITPKRNGNS